ncbi:hypothetical protein ACFWDG_09045 [Peribacillus sp. NPDC060186]
MITQAFHHHKTTRNVVKALGVTQSLFMRRLAKYAITKEK